MRTSRTTMYKLAPQMRIYDNFSHEWKPFIMYSNKKNLRTKVVNTDNLGLRFNSLNNNNLISIFDQKNTNQKFGLIVGSSTAFGLGCSEDDQTISSKLSKLTGTLFFNLGVSAFSGFQEVILHQSLINKVSKAKHIFIFSGLNDLFMQEYISKYDDELGPYFYSNQFKSGMHDSVLSKKRKIAKFLFSSLLDENTDWQHISKKELIENMFKRKIIFKNDRKLNPTDLKNFILRNLTYWSNIQKVYKTKIKYILQPFPAWCKKNLTQEEREIFEELDKNNLKVFKVIKSLENYYTEYKKILSECCDISGIEFIDSNDYFKNNVNSEDWCFLDRAHLTDKGNQHISDFMFSILKGDEI